MFGVKENGGKITALVVLVFFSDEYFWLVVPGAHIEVKSFS